MYNATYLDLFLIPVNRARKVSYQIRYEVRAEDDTFSSPTQTLDETINDEERFVMYLSSSDVNKSCCPEFEWSKNVW